MSKKPKYIQGTLFGQYKLEPKLWHVPHRIFKILTPHNFAHDTWRAIINDFIFDIYSNNIKISKK